MSIKKTINIYILLLLLSSCSITKNRNKPSTTNQEAQQDKNFSLRFVGDVILTVSINHYIKKHGTGYPLRKMTNYLSSADYTIANLESCFSTNGKAYRRKKYTFRAKPAYMKILKKAGIDAVTLANNHLLDFGQKGMRSTMRALKKYKISSVGAGKNLSHAIKPLTIKIKGTTIHIFSFCEVYPPTFHATKKRAGTAPYQPKQIIKLIKKWKNKNNIVIISPHWGWELRPIPRTKHIKDARRFIEAGCDAIIGHHPHVPQSIEIYKKRPIVYSLGNFIVGFYNYNYRNNIGITLHFKKNKLKKMAIHSIAGKNLQTGFQPYTITGKKAKRDIRYLNWISRKFKTKIKNNKDGSGSIKF